MSTTLTQDPVAELRVLHDEAINLFLQSNEIRKLLAENLARTQFLIGANFKLDVPEVAESNTAAAKPIVAKAPSKPVQRAPSQTPSSSSERNLSLRQVIWELLSRPENANGLDLIKIVETIIAEKSWTSPTSGDNFSTTAYQTLYALKKDGKINRGEGKRFYIPEGVDL